MNNLRNLRMKKGLSAQKLSNLTGISLNTIESWESEKNQITLYHRMKRISEVLECDIEDLMVREEQCLYDGIKSVMLLVQLEDGVSIKIVEYEELFTLFKTLIPREKALMLLKNYIKSGKDVKLFFTEIET